MGKWITWIKSKKGIITCSSIITFIVMAILYYSKQIKYDFIIAWTALFGGVGGIVSWITKNETLRKNDSERLSDSQKEKMTLIAEDIITKIYELRNAIKYIAEPYINYLDNHQDTNSEKETPKGSTDIYIQKLEQHKNTFDEYSAIVMKADIYFDEEITEKLKEVEEKANKLKSLIFSHYFERKIDEKIEKQEEINSFYEKKIKHEFRNLVKETRNKLKRVIFEQYPAKQNIKK